MRSPIIKTGKRSLALSIATILFLSGSIASATESTVMEPLVRGQTGLSSGTSGYFHDGPMEQAYAPNYHVSYQNYSDMAYGIDACSDCGECGCVLGNGLFPCHRKNLGLFYVDGWISGGGVTEPQSPITTNAPGGGVNSSFGNVQLNQAYVVIGREAPKCNRISVGGRVDLLWGSDYLYTSALGLESSNRTSTGIPAGNVYAATPKWNTNGQGGYPEYGFALPQAYAEIYAPILEGLSLKLGHFYSPLGYESVMATSNFFYTHSYTMLYGEAKTLTGLMANQQLNQNWSILAGFGQGWDVWENQNNALNVFAGIKWENVCKTSAVSFTAMSGEEPVIGQPTQPIANGQVTNYSLVYQQNITPALQYVLQHDLGIAKGAGYMYDPAFNFVRTDGQWYTLTNYLYYQVTDSLAIGGRVEWFKDVNQTRFLASPPTEFGSFAKIEGNNYYAASLGLNWKPTRWITIRPEVRWDWTDTKMVDGAGNTLWKGPYSNFSKNSICTFAGDMVIRF